MDAQQISTVFNLNHHTYICFRGCFLNNNIPKQIINEDRCFFVINSLMNIGEIGHWVMMYINKKKLCFFDSFGHTPDFYGGDMSRIYDLYPYEKSVIFERPVQSFDSSVCGAYVIYFGYEMCKYSNQFLVKNSFSRFKRENDKKVVRYVDDIIDMKEVCCRNFCPRYMYNINCKKNCKCNH